MVHRTRQEPAFVVWSEAGTGDDQDLWRFVVKTLAGRCVLEVADHEPEVRGERLELLAAVRALEALERPSQVMLVTPSRYVRRGVSYGLESWRRNGWRWESYGQLVPVKNIDLWQRLDRALVIHQVRCGSTRLVLRQEELTPVPEMATATAETRREPRLSDRVRNAYGRLRHHAGNGVPAPHCHFTKPR